MNVTQSVREIQRSTPAPPRRRAAHGSWIEPAQVVKGLVTAGWQVSDAVREVVNKHNMPEPEKAFKGIRAAYYAAMKKEAEEFEV